MSYDYEIEQDDDGWWWWIDDAGYRFGPFDARDDCVTDAEETTGIDRLDTTS